MEVPPLYCNHGLLLDVVESNLDDNGEEEEDYNYTMKLATSRFGMQM